MKRRLLAVCTLALVAAGFGLSQWVDRPSPSTEQRNRDASVELRRLLTEEARAPAAAARLLDDAGRNWWSPPFATVFADMQTAANGGDMSAAYALGSRAADCMKVLRDRTPEAILADFREEMEWADSGAAQSNPGHRETRRRNVSNRFARDLDTYENCAAIGMQRLGGHLDWLERAGAAGDLNARLRFVTAFESAYENDRGALITNIEEAGRRRALARAWLEDLVQRGEESAFHVYAEALQGSLLYRADYKRAMAYAYALELVRERRVGNFEQRWREGLRPYGDRLTPAQWLDASRHGREIFRATLQDRPVWPHGAPSFRPRPMSERAMGPGARGSH